MSEWIKAPKAYQCWLVAQEDLGSCYTLAMNADQARYTTALSAFDAGYLHRPSPHMVRCRRCPEHDKNPALREGWCSTEDHVLLGNAVAAQSSTP